MSNELSYKFTKFSYNGTDSQVDFSITDVNLDEIVEEFQKFLSASGFIIDPGSVLMFTNEASKSYHERKEETAANLKKDQDEWMDFTQEHDGWLKVNKAKRKAANQETPDPSNLTEQLEIEQQKLREKAIWDGCSSVGSRERDWLNNIDEEGVGIQSTKERPNEGK